MIDTNVLVRALLDETDSATSWVNAIDERRVEALAPDLIYAELSSALTQYVRKSMVSHERAVDILATAASLALETRPSRLLSGIACTLALREGLTAYDGHYLALAETEEAVLVTADRKLAAAVTRRVLLA